jgi:polar amino acid transport system substrate-binding protein
MWLWLSDMLHDAALAAQTDFTSSDTLAGIKARKQLVVGIETDCGPFGSLRSGAEAGFSVDIAKEIAASLDVEMNIVPAQRGTLLPALLSWKFDIALSGISFTKSTLDKICFSNPIAVGTLAFLVRASDENITKPEEMCGKIVAAQPGSFGDHGARLFDERLRSGGKEGFKSYKLFDKWPDAIADLKGQRIDGVAAALPALQALVLEQPGCYRVVDGIEGIEAHFGMAARKNDLVLLDHVNRELAIMKSDDRLRTLQLKWFGAEHALPGTIPSALS